MQINAWEMGLCGIIRQGIEARNLNYVVNAIIDEPFIATPKKQK